MLPCNSNGVSNPRIAHVAHADFQIRKLRSDSIDVRDFDYFDGPKNQCNITSHSYNDFEC